MKKELSSHYARAVVWTAEQGRRRLKEIGSVLSVEAADAGQNCADRRLMQPETGSTDLYLNRRELFICTQKNALTNTPLVLSSSGVPGRERSPDNS